MQLGRRPAPLPDSPDLAGALRQAARTLGHRPAITVLRTDRRDEQGFASLQQWAAKGAHYLTIEHMLEPGEPVGLIGPAGWLPAAVCLAAWWAGCHVVVGERAVDAPLLVRHADVRTAPPAGEVVVYGDAIDGAPTGDTADEPYVVAVQVFPDQPPEPVASADLPALATDTERLSQRELLARSGTWGDDGTLGLERADDPAVWVPALAVRPLITGRPTVLLAGADRDAAAGEQVARWI